MECPAPSACDCGNQCNCPCDEGLCPCSTNEDCGGPYETGTGVCSEICGESVGGVTSNCTNPCNGQEIRFVTERTCIAGFCSETLVGTNCYDCGPEGGGGFATACCELYNEPLHFCGFTGLGCPEPDLCDGVICAACETCDPLTGACDVFCTPGPCQTCDSATESCEEECDLDTQFCNAAGDCEDNCASVTCPVDQECDPATGICS